MVVVRHWEVGEGEFIFVSKELKFRTVVVMMTIQGRGT